MPARPSPLPPDYHPDFAPLTGVLLRMARARSVDECLDVLVGLTDARPHVVRSAVWLRDGDRLRLRASRWRGGDTAEWTHTSGDYREVPLSEPLIGQVALDGVLAAARTPDEWPTYPPWAARDGVVAYFAAPIRHNDDVLGCYAGFLGHAFTDDHDWHAGLSWTQVFADQLAAMLVHVRAFEEISRLKALVEQENDYLRSEVSSAKGFTGIIGASPVLQRTLDQIAIVAASDATVLILGESGTGKELVARAIHERSARQSGPLITANCAAIPRELFESEFFGHVRGSFTGAVRDRAGRFDLAHRGTLFLDEVGEIPIDLQGKMLRVLQEGTFQRVGDEHTRRADVRLVAATNRDLEADVAGQRFRQDLYYRLSVFPIRLPPLRERGDDIALLAEHFVRQFARQHGRRPLHLSATDLDHLKAHAWPGNIRELRNVIERAVLTGSLVGLEPLAAASMAAPSPPPGSESTAILRYSDLEALERRNLVQALELAGGRVRGPGGAAERLGLKPTTLASKIKALGLEWHLTPRAPTGSQP